MVGNGVRMGESWMESWSVGTCSGRSARALESAGGLRASLVGGTRRRTTDKRVSRRRRQTLFSYRLFAWLTSGSPRLGLLDLRFSWFATG